MRAVLGLAILLCACSGGGGSPASAPAAPALAADSPVSGFSPFTPGCEGGGGTPFLNAEVEPHLVVDPRDANHLVAAWQQDRFSNGSAQGLLAAASFDGGASWTIHALPFSACAGEGAARGGEFLRATDPWLAFGADGTVFAIGLATRGGSFAAGSTNAILVSRSLDGGRTWSDPVALIRDGAAFLDDKETITADPIDARFVYAVWDRVDASSQGPAYFARSLDRGLTWEAARVIDDPGTNAQTIGNVVRVLPDGTLVCLLTHLVGDEDQVTAATLEVLRSGDRGVTWSAPIRIASLQALGAHDPVTGKPIRDGSIVAQMAVAPDGTLAVAWQDGRFSGLHDSVALARSRDGGLTWSQPVRVNADPAATAFTPQVHARSDGTLGVGYFTLRERGDPGTIPADYRLAQSPDGEHWSETTVSAPFDLSLAPTADGGAPFLGDYMGLTSAGSDFLALYVRTTGSLADRTDVFFARVAPPAKKSTTYRAGSAQAERDADFARRVAANLAGARADRLQRSEIPSLGHSRAP
jgi:hypothetical protein